MGFLIKWGAIGLALIMCVQITPLYVDAWKTKKIVDLAAAKSIGMSRAEIMAEAARKIDEANLASVPNKGLIKVDRVREGWVVSAAYSTEKHIWGRVTLVFDFDLASDRAFMR
ncbi:DUF4845 domain-containing protein [Azonexus hydrophilus]|uniref:DUF4845 domain-containing protein n=1 Tax=Azonexus hydrophilus TaxID=418702 RepID=A0ABZ2XMW8_9RHOO